ncbi:MAG: AzlD domain-containing protein [Peptococcaceae bacterium]|jgi:branched-subunit amino acid transport protein|nr:AzlD domain-containing protein [Peptococcaceae bacterium]MBQ5659570.1 AzlD domain-containing protein [Peptococcaceae bacterium]MBQ5668224.1 AzlD domain-containing protein [Peptococcaceae bacterium]MBQ5708099.1 AzlD domain-containing protein [Peptococcaceae bacterium]
MIRMEVLLIILGMTAVTYIPRALPAVILDKLKFSAKVEKFLKLIPYTAMTALIFPGIFTVDTAHPAIGIVGGLVAILLAWRKVQVIICVLAAIGADILLYMLIG